MGRKAANKQGARHGIDENAACGPHVAFYKGDAASTEGTLVELLAWKGNYKKLEENHAYIQWLFPNYFDSKFNAESRALTHDEACIFREDLDIARKYVKSYRLFLDFLGLQLLDERSGTVGRARGGAGRLRKALVQNIHNHLRVRRVLASFAVTGFQRYMAPLVAYLRWEITGSTEQLLDLVTDLSRITCGERPVLTELAKPASRSDRCFLDVLNDFVDGNATHFRENTKTSMDDGIVSILLQEKDQKAEMRGPSKLSDNEQAAPAPKAKGKKGKARKDDDDEDEEDDEPAPKAKAKPGKGKQDDEEDEDEEEDQEAEEDEEDQPWLKAKAKAKAPPAPKAMSKRGKGKKDDDDNDDEIPAAKASGKKGRRRRRGDDDYEDEEILIPAVPKAKAKGKAKAQQFDEDSDNAPPRAAPRMQSAFATFADSSVEENSDEESEEEKLPPKKKEAPKAKEKKKAKDDSDSDRPGAKTRAKKKAKDDSDDEPPAKTKSKKKAKDDSDSDEPDKPKAKKDKKKKKK